jgi:putative oxidoreductase
MTTAILTVHLRPGIWNSDGGFELPLVMLTVARAVSALGPGSYSIDSWVGVANWADVHWAAADAARAGAAVGIGAAAGLLTIAVGRALRAWDAARHAPSPAQ